MRPAGVKAHHNSPVLVRKWVLDTSSAHEEGTEEEMAAAALVVASSEGLLDTEVSTPVPASGAVSGTATPAVTGDTDLEAASSRAQLVSEAFPAPALVATSTTGSATPTVESPAPAATLPVVENPLKPATGPPASPDLSLPPAHDAVAALEGIQLPLPVDVDMGDAQPFIEDEVLLAQEATAATIDMVDVA